MDPLIYMIVIGLVAGFLAGQIWKGGGFGLIGDLVVGVIGSFIGGKLIGGMFGGGMIGSIIVAMIGALLLLFVLRLIKKA